ncbi:MAG: hypothetical protein ABL995_07515 [Bryobacteraceae bacterium]
MASSIQQTGRLADSGNGGTAERLIPREAVEAELSRVLSSQTFQSAEGQRRFLRFVVEQTVAGLGNEIKEYSIGVEAFDRGQSFDPRLDNIVRAEARKLRVRLPKYYATEGAANPLRIEFPSRGYVPLFQYADSPSVGHPEDATEAPLELTSDTPATLLTPDSAAADGANTLPDTSSVATGTRRAVELLDRKWMIAAVAVLLVIAAAAVYSVRNSQSSWGAHGRNGPSIAVLPFKNFGDNSDVSFSDGLAEELIDALGRVRGLQVVASTSAFQFRDHRGDIREIGKKLNVDTILEGSVRAYGDRLRITVELADTSTGFRLWSNSYDREFKDALFIQRDIAQSTVAALSSGFTQSGTGQKLEFQPSKAAPVNAKAYQNYLRGLYFWNKQTAESVKTAAAYFEQAISEDPSYALSYAGLARCYVNMPGLAGTSTLSVVPKIQQLATKVLELDSSLADAHMELAYAAYLSYSWESAAEEFKRGLELGPGDSVAHRWYGVFLSEVGPIESALAENQLALQLDPVSPYMLDGVGRSNYLLGRYEEAFDAYKKAVALDNQYGYGHLGLGITQTQRRKYPEAIAELKLARDLMGPTSPAAGELGYAYGVSGDVQHAREILNFLLEQSNRKLQVSSKTVAQVYAGLGDDANALKWLEKAVQEKEGYLYLRYNPTFHKLRSNPEFQRLMQLAGLTK